MEPLKMNPKPKAPTTKGAAGIRLREHLKTALPEALLRDFARESLGAQRLSSDYLEALRIVLGNQAVAERRGYILELNQRVTFASARTMRTIIDQMQAAGITYSRSVGLGVGRSQVVQCFGRRPSQCTEANAADELERMSRAHEGEAPMGAPEGITEEDVPY